MRSQTERDVTSLVREHQGEVWRYLRYLGANRELADDLTQETFLQLLRAPFQDQGRAARAAWLRTVARNLYLRTFRRPPLKVLDLDAADAAWVDFVGDDDGAERLAALRLCMEELDGRSRDAVRLQYEERCSREELGAAFGLSGDGVKSLLRRIRSALRNCVERRIGA